VVCYCKKLICSSKQLFQKQICLKERDNNVQNIIFFRKPKPKPKTVLVVSSILKSQDGRGRTDDDPVAADASPADVAEQVCRADQLSGNRTGKVIIIDYSLVSFI